MYSGLGDCCALGIGSQFSYFAFNCKYSQFVISFDFIEKELNDVLCIMLS